MTRHKLLLGFLLSQTYIQLKAQTTNHLIKIGDKMPDIIYTKLANYNRDSLKISDFKGKLIILDIWNKYCSACISGFPQMQDLQKKFAGQIQVLLVTSDTKEDYLVLKKKSPIIRNVNLPFVFEDVSIKKLFPNSRFPLHIWIDSAMRVKAITQGYNATAENIQDALAGKILKVHMQQDDILDFDSSVPLFVEGGGRLLSNQLSYSFFMSSLKNVTLASAIIIRDSITNSRIGLRFINMTLPLLYKYAYGRGEEEIVFDFENYKRYLKPGDQNLLDDYFLNYTFCYEFRIKENNGDNISVLRRKMQKDLASFFGLTVTEKKIKRKCYKLIRLVPKNNFKLPSDDIKKISLNTSGKIEIKNSSIKDLTKYLQKSLNTSQENTIPVLNATGYEGNISIKLEYDKSNLSSLNKELNKYGFGLIESKRKLNTLIISNTKVDQK